MNWQHYINGQEVTAPRGWDGAKQVLKRNIQARTLAVEYQGEVTFVGDGYDMLRGLFVSSAGCAIVQYEAYTMCGGVRVLAVRANIILADCDWNLNRCEVACSIVEDGIGARIANNGKVPISPTAERTKNGIPLTPVTAIPLQVFNSAGTYLPNTRAAYDYLECLQHAVRFMSDQEVTLQSTWYNALPDDERFSILTGFQLRTGANTAPEDERLRYKWSDLFREIAIKYNLWIYVKRDVNGAPIVRLEREEDIYADTVAISLPWQDNLIQSIDQEQTWAAVEVGSEDGIANRGATDPLPYLVLQGFSTEAFSFEGVCNTEAVLDLVSKWGICTNLINKVAIQSSSEHDELVFVIQYNRTTNQATIGDYFGAVALYNKALLNINVLNRYQLPSNVGQYFGPGVDNFRASATSNGAIISDSTWPSLITANVPLNFDDDSTPPNFDPSNLWDTTLLRFTAPVQGFYALRVSRSFRVSSNTFAIGLFGGNKYVTSRITVRRFNASNVLQGTQIFNSTPQALGLIPQPAQFLIPATWIQPAGNYLHEINIQQVMDVGDYLLIDGAFVTTSVDPLNTGVIQFFDLVGSTIETTFIAAGGGTLTNIDPSAARVVTLTFSRLVDADTWADLVGNPTQAIRVATDGGAWRTGHILSADNNLQRGEASWTLTCKRDQI
jgi:hypothetical protein